MKTPEELVAEYPLLTESLVEAIQADAQQGMVQAKDFGCFKCEDHHTPLYCLNCAREGMVPVEKVKSLIEALREVHSPEAVAAGKSLAITVDKAIQTRQVAGHRHFHRQFHIGAGPNGMKLITHSRLCRSLRLGWSLAVFHPTFPEK